MTYTGVPTATWEALVSAAYDIADAQGVPLIDNTDAPDELWTTANARGLMASDGLHPRGAGYRVIARNVFRLSRPSCSSS